jgi:endoglucanase
VIRDGSMVPNLRLRDLFIDTAMKLGIPYQFDILERGGTDSGAIHLHRRGVPNLVVAVPTRHIHSHAGNQDMGRRYSASRTNGRRVSLY